MEFKSHAIAPSPPEEVSLSPRVPRESSLKSRVSSKTVSDAAEHPISQMVFTAVSVGFMAAIFFYLKSLYPVSDFKLIRLLLWYGV